MWSERKNSLPGQFFWFTTFTLLTCQSFANAKRSYYRDPGICGLPTCTGKHKFGFTPGVKYEYSYNIKIDTTFDGAGNITSDINMHVLFNLQFRTKCEGVLQITDAWIINGTNERNHSANLFKTSLSQNRLRFHFENGIIPQICPTPDEPVWVLNLKKGILSSFQNSMDRFDVDQFSTERDINGDCISGYFFKQVNNTEIIIDKIKELASCTNRYHFYSLIPTTPYIFQKRYHKWTPLNSAVVCQQHIDHNIYEKIVCREMHAYQPFYNQTNGAITTSEQEIILISQNRSSYSDKHEINSLGLIEQRDSLLFDHRRPKYPTHDDLYECEQLLTSLCFLAVGSIKPQFPDVLNRFIHIARHLTTPALANLYKKSDIICPTGKKYFLEALPYIRSRASTSVMTDVILSKEISSSTMQEWLLVMSFIPRPDAETVDSVSQLLFTGDFDAQTMLAVSTVLHSFCENNNNCQESSTAIKIINTLENMFNSTCINNQNIDRAYSSLKALGNAGVPTHTLIKSLQTCILNEALPVSLRIEAINVHRRLPCELNEQFLSEIYSNQDNDQEIRIAAYLQIMKCPSYSILEVVKTTLNNETFNQVGSFVFSHLQTQLKSVMPRKVIIQAILQDVEWDNKFDKDFRKFSRNFEHSFYLNSFGVGGFVETNVIFSQQSYIPRSVTFNVTVDLFGESINLFEISLYMENLEKYVEKWSKKWKMIIEDNINTIFNHLRVVRSVQYPLKELLDSVAFKKVMKEVKVSISLKLFGNEIKYYRINTDEDFQEILEFINPMKIIANFLSGKEIKHERSVMFLDMSYTTPMNAGVPLKINAVGTAAVNVNAMGFINSSKLREDSELEIDGKLKPTIGINFEGSMVVDNFILNTGVKFKGRLFTSTAVEGSIKAESYKFLSISFNLPMKKSVIISVETELILLNGHNEVSIEGITAGRVENRLCTWSILDEVIGLKFCTNSLLPNATLLLKSPLFIFSGPLKFTITLEKSDPTAEKYIIQYKWDTVANKTKISFHFETPGSISKRGMKAVVDLDTQSQNLTLIYESPRSQVQAQGFYQNSPSQKSINFGLNINGKKHIDIKVGMDIEREKYGNSYTPKILLAINDKRIAELSGTIRWVEKKGVAQGDIDLDFKTNKFTTVIAGYVRKTNFSVSTNIKMNYKFGSGTEETVRVELKLGDRSSKYLTQLFGNLQIESTAYPQINLITSLKYQKAQDHTECKIDSYTNPYIDDDNKKLHVQWEYRFLNSYMLGSKMNTSLLITKPSSNIDISIGLVHHDHSSDSTSRTTLITKYATGKEMKVNLFLKLPHGSHFYFQSTIIISLPVTTQDMSIFTKIYEKEQSYREYDIDFEGRWFSGHNFTIKGVYQDLSTLLLTSHSVKLRARSELFKDVYLYGQVKMSEDEYGTDLRADHDNIDYRVVLWHYSKAQGMYETYGEVKYNKSLYSVTNNIDLAYRQTTLDLHLDKFRDIQVSIRGLSNKTMIDAGLDVKWDANRDPSQKVVVIIATNSYGNMHCDGKAILEYPGRIIKSLFLTQHKGTDYILSASAEWSPKNKVIIFFQGTYDIPDHGYARFNSRLSTPFPKWEYSALDYELKVEEKGIQSNGCLSWINNKKITFGLAGNYMYTENDIYFNFASSLNSTIPGINSMYAIFKHKRIGQKYDTVIALQSNPNQVISITSSGLIFSSSEVIKYIFNLGISSPFVIITKASAELYIYPNQRFRGSVQMNENGKKYITVIEGSVKTWNESKINFHISTPIEKYKLIHAKFGFSASKKHLIAEIKAPTSAVGVEIIYIYNNISDFDLKFHVHTSIMFINSLLLVGKINYEIVDLRCGWNVLLVGLTGSSHYESWKDVDYRLQIFTPIEGYYTSSVIAKFIYDEKIDFEFSLNFAAKKFGIMVQAMHKPDDDFALPVKPMLKNESMLGSLPYYPLEFEEPEYGNIFWRGVLKLDSLFYPSVTAYIQINDDEEVEYSIVSFFDFPFGQLKLKDNLEYIDLLNIKNKLNITTTCECLMEISGTFVISGTMNRNVVSKIEIIKISYNETTQGSSDVSYSFTPLEEGSMFEGRHSLYFKAKTPFLVLSNCDFYLNLNLKKQVYEADVSAIINKSVFILNGTLKTDENYLDSNLATRVNTPHFVLPMCQIKLRKDFTDIEKKLSIGLALPNEKGDGLVNYGAAVLWHSDGPNYMKYLLQILTPYKNIGAIKGSVEYKMDPEGDEYFLESFIKYSETSDVRVRGIIQKNRLIFKIESSFQSFRNIEINTTIKSIGNVRTLDTELTTNKEHRIQGWASLTPDRPLMIEMKLLKSATKAEILSVHIIITKNILGYEVNSLVQYNGQSININGNYVLLEKLGNKLNLLITSTYPGYKELQLNTLLLTTNSKAIVSHVSGATSSKWINTTIDLSFNASLTEIGGVIHTSVISPIFRSNIRLIWLWELLEHMLCSISGDYSYSEIKSDIFLRLYYWNIENKKMSVGIDVNYNQLEWLLSTNATLIIPSWNDFLFGSYMLLPQKREELHTVLAKLRYAKNFTYFSHLLEYLPHSNKSALQTLSEISITKTLSKGTMLLEAGRHRLFDKFHALPDNNGYKIDNFLQSTNMDEDLYFTLHYKKPESNQLFLLDVFYPPSVPIISSYIEFSALNNMLARMNCTVPFKSIPSTTVMLKIVTSPTFYQRYGQVFWNNNTAIFNYTHSSQFQINKNMTDGSIVIEFPLVTRHKGNLNYFYESSEMFANGHSKLEYNDEIIMSGNYSRSTKLTVLNKHEIINMNVNNSYVPVWITYIKQFNKHNKNNKYPFTVLKRVEIFQMDPGPSFNITGEMSTYETSTDKLVSLKAIHGHRSLTVHTFRKGLTKFSTMANFTLKPNVWAGYGIKLIKKRDFMGQRLELNITYPRRLLKINGEYDWTENQLNTKISIFPNENKRANPIAADLHWKQVSISPQCHEASVMIFHPSFKKNISLSGIYRQNLNTPINIDINLEYSTDNKKRLMLGTIIENKSDKSARYYEISAVGRHPATRLNLSFTGLFKLYESLLEVHKNISYTESNFENNFWNFRVKVDKIRKSIEIERESLRDSGYILARYGNKNPVYTANVTFANGSDLNISGDFSIDIKNYVTQLLINFTPDATEQFHMLGECKDNRQGFIDLWRTYDGIKISDLSIFSVLNHSRMASSTIKWRPNVRKDIMILIQNSSEYIWSYTTQTANFLTEKVKSKTIDSILNIWYDAKPILQNFIDDIRDTKNLQEDIEQFKVLYNESYYANEFYMRDIYHIYLVIAEEISFSGHVPRIFNEIWDILGGTGESIRQSILWIVESMKNLYEKFQRFLKSVMSGDTLNQLTQNLQEIAGKYDKLIKDTHIMFLHYVEYLWAETSHRIYSYWSKFLKAIEPTYYEIINYIDTVIVGGAKNLIDFIFQKQSQFLSSTFFRTNSHIRREFDQFFHDITKNGVWANAKKYSKMLMDLITDKYFELVPFGYELNEISTEIIVEIKELYTLPFINFTIETTKELNSQVIWVYNYLKIGDKLSRIIPILYTTAVDLSHTALENEIINHEGRTKFIFDPENGLIKLEQKLPVPWHAFNETPNFEEIPEYKTIKNLQKLLAPSNKTFWIYYYSYIPLLDPLNWLPPFKDLTAQAFISGGQHFITFDGKHFEFKTPCTYLLAKDFVDETFTLVFKYEHNTHNIVLIVGQHVITVDMLSDALILGEDHMNTLPLQLGELYLYREEGIIFINSNKRFSLKCNVKFGVCTFTLSGWYFGKTAGLLGTMDNEPANDFLTSTGIIETNIDNFITSWALGLCTLTDVTNKKQLNTKHFETCSGLFLGKTSTFSPCFSLVDPHPFNALCQRNLPGINNEVCTAAFSYIKACGSEHLPLRMPNLCTSCSLPDGTLLEEGNTHKIGGKDVPMSTDVIFIVEAKHCTKYWKEKKTLQIFMSVLGKELKNVGLINNRYGVVTFGGNGVFEHPRSIYVNNQFFTSEKNVPYIFERIPAGDGKSDIFGALRYASTLPFRPGVAKTFILFPCSTCHPANMTVEYSVISHVLMENDITLHILMNVDFHVEKQRSNKLILGLDSENAYTKHDLKQLKGDRDLRRQIKLTKDMLGYCTPLAIETNGTIFTGKKLHDESMSVKKFSSIFAKRIAVTAEPDSCQLCECIANSDGMQYIECLLCEYTVPEFLDFDNDDNYTIFQTLETPGD